MLNALTDVSVSSQLVKGFSELSDDRLEAVRVDLFRFCLVFFLTKIVWSVSELFVFGSMSSSAWTVCSSSVDKPNLMSSGSEKLLDFFINISSKNTTGVFLEEMDADFFNVLSLWFVCEV
ncbi:hypothetical protein BpHYR1_012105 [Brachionus plicatilis]|uniref:Uncharacterized protein n=1 Tax=Brachionus plicatilis TaxID=10195 RepID=A0A3M7R332_BRAPC|nr:hypothetical protein BpHYR1_012105 [Brachionus plicatilis]